MLLSRRNIWAVANIIFWAIQVEASSHRRRRDEAPPPKRQVNEYFQTEWTLPPKNVWPLNTNQTTSYTVTSDVTVLGGEELPLLLLWTNVQSGILTPDNTWFLYEIPKYVCNNIGLSCIWTRGSSGDTVFSIAPNPAKDIWTTGNYFLCFGTPFKNSGDKKHKSCRSFSQFFTLQHPAQQAPPALPASQVGSPSSLIVPTSVLQIFQTTDILATPSAAVTPAPTAPAIPSTLSTADGSASLTTSTRPDGSLTTILVISMFRSVVATSTEPATSSPSSSSIQGTSTTSKAKSVLPMGAIIGIAIGGAAILVAILIFAFLCYRRRRRTTKTPSEQVLLADNMAHHPHSLEKLDVDISNHSANSGMLGSILETRPSSGPYDHVQSSAPYSGPLGPHRRTLSGQLPVAAVPAALSRGASDASAHTPISPRSTLHGNETRSLNRTSMDARSISVYDEPYQDVPLYGDARHVPHVFNGRNPTFVSPSPTPFLSEPGMSREEIERLEEEERRIDAAIAEAERRR